MNQIPDKYSDKNCPLCMQPLIDAAKVIEYYRIAFDQTYSREKQKYLSDIQEKKNEIALIKEYIDSLHLKVIAVFDALEKIKTEFMIQNLYDLTEKAKYIELFNDISIAELVTFIEALESLKNIDRELIGVSDIYEDISNKIKKIQKHVDNLNELTSLKNQTIADFKSKYSDQHKIALEIQENTNKHTELKELLNFLISDKIKQIKNKNDQTNKQSVLSKALKDAQSELKSYLAETIPVNIIDQMIVILKRFSLSFTLQHIKPAQNTKDYSFSFEIKDKDENELEFKDGLSEGERQLISIAFFFAINENLINKQKKVLIFDDPITSLDSPNLKILADLIHEKTSGFMQVIVFTHHPLFFKYLKKHVNSSQFGILNNHKAFGGSFVYVDPGFDLVIAMQNCSEEIELDAKRGCLIPEEIALKYGQLLRLAVERFIKNDLLMWNKEKNFDDLIDNLKHGKNKMTRLADDDLEIIKNIYKYCNYSNLLHVDKENPSALSELITHINKFSKILEKTI